MSPPLAINHHFNRLEEAQLIITVVVCFAALDTLYLAVKAAERRFEESETLTAVDAQVLFQMVFVFEGLGTFGALELAGSSCSS